MSYLYFALQLKSRTEELYRAIVVRKGGADNLAHMTEDYGTEFERVVTVNCWPKSKCDSQVRSWNDDFKARGELMPWDYSPEKRN